MWPNARAVECMSQQMGYFMGHCLLEKMCVVFLVELPIEAQQITLQIGNTGLLTAQIKSDLGALKGTFEVLFSQLIAVFQSVQNMVHGAL